MKNVKKPPKWVDVYPQGTKEGDEEFKFFKVLSRGSKTWDWRKVEAIAKESGLTPERVEQIINKYYKKGMVFPKPNNESYWGYWERIPEDMLPKKEKTVSQKDKEERIGKISKKGSFNMVSNIKKVPKEEHVDLSFYEPKEYKTFVSKVKSQIEKFCGEMCDSSDINESERVWELDL